MTDKLDEIRKILNKKVNIDINSKIKNLKNKYKEELKDFTYVSDQDFFFKNKRFYVRYVGFNDKLYYGGFFLKVEETLDKFSKKTHQLRIYLVNTDKKIWSIDFNKNYVFINKILSNDEKMRKTFEEYLKTIN